MLGKVESEKILFIKFPHNHNRHNCVTLDVHYKVRLAKQSGPISRHAAYHRKDIETRHWELSTQQCSKNDGQNRGSLETCQQAEVSATNIV